MGFLSAVEDVCLLPFIYIKSKLFEKNQELHNKNYYKQDPSFKKLDLAFLESYKKINPFKISKAYLKNLGASNVYQYGETPLSVYETLANRWSLTSKDYFVELGCGRARGGLFLQHFYKCQYLGIDWVPDFINKARFLQRTFHLDKTAFRCEDMLKAKLEAATWVYLHGATFEDEHIEKLILKLKELKDSTLFITVSFPLDAYDSSFYTLDSFESEFSFGKTSIYLNRKRP